MDEAQREKEELMERVRRRLKEEAEKQKEIRR